ncbi:MAG: peptide chain release factor N(5)-glutamine methyltransferase [Clostridia bacterium]|nr:peptide chain release factor N(5)-glutamine methyltransferase [Clostridia bacterium]
MNNVQKLFIQGKQILEAGGCETGSFDAACLFTHFYGISRADMPLCDADIGDPNLFLDACKKRAGGYPLQYILGKWEFYGLEFTVTPDVLIPRADTETLIDYVKERYGGRLSILDMCCGSGCIGLTLKKLFPEAEVTLCDISEDALAVTKQNADALGISVSIRKADLLRGGRAYFEDGSFDIIISNPPYITASDMQTLSKEVLCEPHIALFGGEDGMDFYSALIRDWKSTLKKGGELILESGYDTSKPIRALFTELGYCDITAVKDLSGIVRVVAAKNGGEL